MSKNVVEIRDLHFSFGDLQVLRGLSLDIPRGQVVAILGGSLPKRLIDRHDGGGIRDRSSRACTRSAGRRSCT